MRPVLPLLVLAACQAQGTVRAAEVVVRDERDAVAMVLTRTATGCATDDSLVIIAAGARTSAGAWTLDIGPTGRELRGPAGLIARVVEEAGPPARLTLIDAIGVPMARAQLDGAAAAISDAGRHPVARVEVAGEGATLYAGEQRAGRISGSTDLELAVRLLVPAQLPDEARALLACERLAAITPAVK